jgi:hypothetical protein
MPRYGTLTLTDLLELQTQSVIEIGEDRMFEAFDTELRLHRDLLRAKYAELVEFTTDRLRAYGGSASVDLDPIDEFGTPDAQKMALTRATLGFPLRRYGISLQWTRHWFQRHTARELALQVRAQEDADVRLLDTEIKRAFFVPTNYTFVDRLRDGASLGVKRLVNADGATIPNGPDGVTFDGSTHTHYLATASLIAANVQSLIDTVTEHYGNGEVFVYINKGSEAAIRALTGFVGFVDPRIHQPDTATYANGRGVDYFNVNNRPIGLFGAAEIWVKPWIPAGYIFAYVRGAPKPVVIRQPDVGEIGLHLEADDEVHPLRARVLAHEFGVGVYERTNGAVLYTGGGSYTAPTL